MIRNFVTSSDLHQREPELLRLKDTEELEALSNKAFGDFCLQAKEEQFNIFTVEPIYFFNNKHVTESKSIKVKVDDYNRRVVNRFVVEKKVTTNEGDNRFVLLGSIDGVKHTVIKEIDIDSNKLQTFKFYISYPYYNFKIISNGELDMKTDCYLVESPYDTMIEFLALSYAFESLIKTNDIYITKANRYRMLYEERFAKLNPEHTSGLYASAEIIGVLR